MSKDGPIDLESVRVLRAQQEAAPLPEDWPSAHAELAKIHALVPVIHADVQEIHRHVVSNHENIHRFSKFVIAAAALVATCVTSVAVTVVVKKAVETQIEKFWAVKLNQTEEDRLARIAAELPQIPRTPRLRLAEGPRRGAPTVTALEDRLPDLGRITVRERDLACERVPKVCQPGGR